MTTEPEVNPYAAPARSPVPKEAGEANELPDQREDPRMKSLQLWTAACMVIASGLFVFAAVMVVISFFVSGLLFVAALGFFFVAPKLYRL